MKITEHLARATEPLVSYEIIPPRRGGSIHDVMRTVEQLARFEPPFIDVTSHAAQVYFEELPDGTLRRHTKRKRPGTIGLCAAIKGRFGIEAVPHLLCSGFTREETEDALIELNFLGIHNVMALRGDDLGFEKPDRPDRSRNDGAAALTAQIAAMNRGEYLEKLLDAAPTDFCIGVAGYPEKHFASPNMAWDVLNLKRKVDAGAHYVVTQMFFDTAHYTAFVARCRSVGIEVPIVPGLKILTSRKQLTSIPRTFHVEIPEALAAEIEAARDEHVREIGVRWAIAQCEELIEAGAPGLHFYILQDASHVTQVVEALRRMA